MHTWNVKLFEVIIEGTQMNFDAFMNSSLSWTIMYERQRKPLSQMKVQL